LAALHPLCKELLKAPRRTRPTGPNEVRIGLSVDTSPRVGRVTPAAIATNARTPRKTPVAPETDRSYSARGGAEIITRHLQLQGKGNMKKKNLTIPEIAQIAGTPVLLGVGLLALGVLSTIPIAANVFTKEPTSDRELEEARF